MFVPAVAGEIALGRWLTQFMPHPGLIAMLCFAPAIVVLFIFGMFIGATIWLLLMKRFVHQNTLATFFLGGPRVPIFSNLLLKDICLVLRPEPTENKTMSLLSLDAGGAKRAFVICPQLSSQTHRGVVFT